MNIEELFAGIGVVIDDKVFSLDENEDRIVKIVKELEEKRKFPLVKYADLPDDDILNKLTNISFLLLDWEIDPRGDMGLDVSLGPTLRSDNEKRVIGFVNKVLQITHVPIFIFSNIDEDTIKSKLTNANIDLEKRQVFVKPKSELVGDDVLFSKIGEWVDNVSGVYVAKAWNQAFCKAKNQFFAEMANNTSHWPKAIFKASVDDKADPGEEITQAISLNIISRMLPIKISQEQIDKDISQPQKEEVLGLMKGQFFLEKECEDSIVGDFYKFKKDDFYINIRPTCDCVDRDSNNGHVYLLECDKLSNGQIKPYQGHLIEDPDCAMVGPLYNGKFYRIKFKELCVVCESECRDKKVGRVLPPIINHITERYGLYIQRQALPRLPEDILPVVPKQDDAENQKELASQPQQPAEEK